MKVVDARADDLTPAAGFAIARLPHTSGPDRPPDLRPRTVERWLAALPRANLLVTGVSLHESLKEANRLSLKISDRLAFLDALRGSIDDAVRGLRSHYTPRQFPPPAKTRRASDLSHALLREIAIGYDRVVQHATDGRQRVGKAPARAGAAAQHLLSRHPALRLLLLISAGTGRDPEALARAVPRRRAARAARCRGCGPDAALRHPLHSRRELQQILLLAATNPHSLRHQELDGLFAALEQLAPATVLQATAAPTAGYYADLRSDLPPQPIVKKSAEHTNIRRLDWQAAIVGLDPAAEPWWSTAWRKPKHALPAELRERLRALLGPTRRRRFPRRPMAGAVHAVLGLAQVGQTLAQQQGVDLKLDKTVQGLSVTVHSSEWDLGEQHRAGLTSTERALVTGRVAAAARYKAAAVPGYHWQVVDTSAGGYRLQLPDQATPARIGEIVGVREADAESGKTWQIGTIRWMRHAPSQGLQIGIQLLGINAIPVTVRLAAAAGPAGPTAIALLMPEMASLRQPMRLLMPSLPCVAGMRVAILDGDGEYEVLLSREHDRSGSFASFEFQPVARESVDAERDVSQHTVPCR